MIIDNYFEKSLVDRLNYLLSEDLHAEFEERKRLNNLTLDGLQKRIQMFFRKLSPDWFFDKELARYNEIKKSIDMYV